MSRDAVCGGNIRRAQRHSSGKSQEIVSHFTYLISVARAIENLLLNSKITTPRTFAIETQ